MHHPSIVEFYRAFAFENHTYVVLELCPNGSLMDMVKNRKSLSLPEVRRYMIQLCGGVKYMHQRRVIHRDLKMGNIFIDAHMNLKIGDFGLAAVVVDDQERRRTMCGTPNYIAPELLAKSSSEGHSHKVDTWAIGIICYAMLIGSPPFASKSQPEIYAKLKQLQYEWKEDCQYFIPNQAKDLVTLCLNLVPAERPGMDDLVEHEFFKMGAIAEEMDRPCLRNRPTWLEHADPRGDKVTPTYGVDHAAICEACGVGKTSTGRLRPSAGRNVNVSTMAEVELENAKGCAPIVPMPDGVIYKEFAAAKEDWNAIRKRPLTSSKVRSRKEPALAAETLDMNSLSKALPKTESPRSVSTTFAPGSTTNGSQTTQQRASVQSFAAQQRQRALPSRAFSRTTVANHLGREAASTGRERVQPARESQSKKSASVKSDSMAQTVGQTMQTSGGFLREQPIRAASRTTRSTSAREKTKDPLQQVLETKSALEEREFPPKRSTEEKQPVGSPSAKVTTTSRAAPQVRSRRRRLSQEIKVDEGASARPFSSSSGEESAEMPLRAIDANDRQLKSALGAPIKPETEPSKAGRHLTTPYTKTLVIAPSDSSTPLPCTSPENVLQSLREAYRDLSPKSVVRAKSSRAFHRSLSNPHPVVEKWVDYTDRYGIGYILSDGTAGLALKSSNDNARSSTCVAIRNAKEHYLSRLREEEVQIVPQGPQALPVEFYESFDEGGLRKMEVPAKNFRYQQERSEKWINGKEVVARLSEQAKEECTAERVRLVGLLDKFGKYMTNLNSSDVDELVETKADSFIKFYQRLGNVGIWGFGDGSFQYNFPDHTKLLVYRSSQIDGRRLMLDLYYLQPEDATYLANSGSMTERSMERRDSISAPISEILGSEDAKYENIFATNQVLGKLSWIRAVLSVWIREGGLGRTGKEKLAWTGLQDKATERSKKFRMVWVTVGRSGGDGELSRRK
jgi:serine/threonine protein kinase